MSEEKVLPTTSLKVCYMYTVETKGIVVTEDEEASTENGTSLPFNKLDKM